MNAYIYQIVEFHHSHLRQFINEFGHKHFKHEWFAAYTCTATVEIDDLENGVNAEELNELMRPFKDKKFVELSSGDIIQAEDTYILIDFENRTLVELDILAPTCGWCGAKVTNDHFFSQENTYHYDCYGELYAYEQQLDANTIQ